MHGRHIGVLPIGPRSFRQSMMFRQLYPHLAVPPHTTPPTAARRKDLVEQGEVLPESVAQVISHRDRLTGVSLHAGTKLKLDASVVATVMQTREDFLDPLRLIGTNLIVKAQEVAGPIETGRNGTTGMPGDGSRELPANPRPAPTQQLAGWQQLPRSSERDGPATIHDRGNRRDAPSRGSA